MTSDKFNLFPGDEDDKQPNKPEQEWEEEPFDPNAYEKSVGSDPEIIDEASEIDWKEYVIGEISSDYEDLATECLRTIANKLLWDVVFYTIVKLRRPEYDRLISDIVLCCRDKIAKHANQTLSPSEMKISVDEISSAVTNGFNAAVGRFKSMYENSSTSQVILEQALKNIRGKN